MKISELFMNGIYHNGKNKDDRLYEARMIIAAGPECALFPGYKKDCLRYRVVSNKRRGYEANMGFKVFANWAKGRVIDDNTGRD